MLRGQRRKGRRRRSCIFAWALVSLATGLSACGGVAGNAVVVRVGNRAFTKASVDHWTSVIKHGGAFGDFRGKAQGTAVQQAVALLVTSSWLIGEAARQGVPVANEAVEEVLAQREHEDGELQKRLRATGQSIADVEFETRAELAAEAIREKLASRADEVTRREVLDFYRQNRHLFSRPEVRATDLIEGQPSAAAATALVRRIGTGRQFTHLAFHEQVSRTFGFTRTPEKARVVDAIFAAKPGVPSRPMPLNRNWAVFIVRKIVPGRPESFAQAKAEAARLLRGKRQRALKAEFDREYTQRWRSRTKCNSLYIGPGCPQSHGPLQAYEDPFSSRAHPLLSEEGVGG